MIERTFKPISDENICDADQHSFLINLGWNKGLTWDDLLNSKRVLIISESGAGKTYECQKQAKRMWDSGKPAFFIELASLAVEDLCSLLSTKEETRLNEWLVSQVEFATFFIDSFDELKLTQGSFERALKRLSKCIGNQLHRARVIITTRPIPFDKKVFLNVLPIPSEQPPVPDDEAFAKVAMGEFKNVNVDKNINQASEWQTVALMPLSDDQITEFAKGQGVQEANLLLDDLQRRNAQEFARRPQDLIELCADWKEHKRIRTHREQVATNVRVKLLARDDRQERAELSIDKAIEGASKLALAVYMTRRLTIRHNAASDDISGETALDPAIILSDWMPNERKALLERPIFGFASYGRVRFHHRSVAEYLASERLLVLRSKGMPCRALQRLIFAETKGKTIVRPSKRAVAAWLALKVDRIFEILRENEPDVLLNEGDPESLTNIQRNQALRAYTDRYGPGGWRGLNVPQIQAHRFASKDLAKEILQIWQEGVENPDVRNILISLIEAGRIKQCSDLVFNQALSASTNNVERLNALDALVAIEDSRLHMIAADIAKNDARWTDKIARGVILRIFPDYMSVSQLCAALRWIKQESKTLADFSWQLPRAIAAASIDMPNLLELRDSLVMLVSENLKWRDEWPHATSTRSHLSGALSAVCLRGLNANCDEKWLYAGVLALKLHYRDHGDDEPVQALRERFSNLSSVDKAKVFWLEDNIIHSLNPGTDAWGRFAAIVFNGGSCNLSFDKDMLWICDALGETSRDIDQRKMLLYALNLITSHRDKSNLYETRIKPLIADSPLLTIMLDDWLKPSEYADNQNRFEKEQAKQKEKEKRKRSMYRASWIQLKRDIISNPDEEFSSEKSRHTAWNLWRAMRNVDVGNSSTGWNRHFIESHFGHETANKLRSTLMEAWRNEQPLFPSERPEHERNTFLNSWFFGLAGVYAEAEDANWASRLNDDEAKLVARYVPLDFSSVPSWFSSLATVHQKAIDLTLGIELSWELNQPVGLNSISYLTQKLDNMPDFVVRLFLPRLISWLDSGGDLNFEDANASGMARRIDLVSKLILKHSNPNVIRDYKSTVIDRIEQQLPFSIQVIWISVLLQIDPQVGIEKLAQKLERIEPSERSEAVTWFASLFGDRQYDFDFKKCSFTPQLLLCLLRLAYMHVRIEDDAYHEGSYTPDTRDDAERARNNIVSALLNMNGEIGLATKIEMANEPSCAHFKDRIFALAEESWAQEIDSDALDEEQVVSLNKCCETPAFTNESMFAILRDRLSDLDDLLLSDVSPRQTWAGISDEKILRREIARELRNTSNNIYTVDQEAVTADEKETDIRLRSICSKYEAVIELKLGDKRSATDLRDTIQNQLVKKYMAANHSKSGALLVTISIERKWEHPVDRRKIDVSDLLLMLREEAKRVEIALGGEHYIAVHLLDLRPRLTIESKSKLQAIL